MVIKYLYRGTNPHLEVGSLEDNIKENSRGLIQMEKRTWEEIIYSLSYTKTNPPPKQKYVTGGEIYENS